jgi:hypothetical protein
LPRSLHKVTAARQRHPSRFVLANFFARGTTSRMQLKNLVVATSKVGSGVRR